MTFGQFHHFYHTITLSILNRLVFVGHLPGLGRGLWLFLCLLLAWGCGSEADRQKRRIDPAEEQAKRDSLALVYDSSKANKEIDEYMTRLHQRSGFNGNVLIAKKGKIVYQNSLGWANHLLRDSLRIDSQFELASVSKPLTAAGVLKLWEEGKLSLDQELQEFFPELPYNGVTVRQLLTHRSGLPNYIYFTDGIWEDKQQGMTNGDVISLLAEHQPARYGQPDGRYFYNNTNYMLLASIIEKVSGQDFAVFMKEKIFKPAGMNNTAVYSKAVYDKIPTHVVGHDKIWRRSVVQNFQDGPVGDKGIYSSVQDLFLFDRALSEGRLLQQETLDSAYTAYSKPERSLFSYGFGWRIFNKKGHKIVYHTGWWHGFRTLYVRDLEKDITIVLLTNLANSSLLHLDRLYQLLDMPVLRRAAYTSKGVYKGD